ncbi:polysaccharide biosynthesis protein [Campylobacter hyointestinalis]|uniref:Polysaccharide biosynthesis protein n=1 Tax=Campylobacter hyointestinalis subsp. hyointestinalis TaxID=91352 RepID=A0A0S4S8R3_CAMHY|nr:3'-5' exonuclease [Campylobacter hyointestinalis]CUU79969.1 polysaccharide biosynthesis protein [Campylobacter hyointestinalis subsp. hyointestinalis]CUU80748.1 polysaccharide biosynthesis protein [Campylobacter hyointestinalis subsp. hyointestinalis]CUU82075.1 polysaccharide biosynthesis protein [Campylobacter hyointestinalis subsp. hyointestinalis]CUU82731.1 polysaccharide biosynthesis protein [Campylobacter hyointestinalis subsp. hyointestinalis]CUU83829.1 polysaccharide biosynthesis pro
MIKSDHICVFDCETVPDSDTLRKVFGYEGDDKEVAKRAMSEQKENTGSEFLPVCFHKVVAISAVMADKFGRFLRVSTMQGQDEEEKITKFIQFINKFNPRLVSFNGRGFDIPMLMIRAMRYNISSPSYFDVNDKENGKDKWTNYRSRYDGIFHLDLLDHISEFRSVSGLKLDHLCSSLNLPGKYDVHGDQVFEMFYDAKIDKINEYCESDTLNTYWLFLKYELLRGNLTKDDYANYISVMSEFLNDQKQGMSYTDVFCRYVEDELKRLS